VEHGFISPSARHIIVQAPTAQDLMAKLEVIKPRSLGTYANRSAVSACSLRILEYILRVSVCVGACKNRHKINIPDRKTNLTVVNRLHVCT
jgi:hypothetical protein